ncbi:MAG: alpha/beta fold hydrolase [Cyanobacteriota bacterium]|nr:alpha/beta fold hydrolase [Cyanobacteriota bacterium]
MSQSGWSEIAAAGFQARLPWLGGDLQTLRDTLKPPRLPVDLGEPMPVPVADGGQLLAVHDHCPDAHGLVLLLHGLGGHSDREGLRRMGLALQAAGFSVLRLNLRGAGKGRALASGTYAAHCNRDLWPVLERARQLAGGKPLLGAGISLGGTILLNACLEQADALDGLVCTSSPLDLAACSASIERPRNRIYQRWLMRRLVAQTLEDASSVTPAERAGLQQVQSIRAFDDLITAPRWGYGGVERYYQQASPAPRLDQLRTPTLLLQADDDPWVPVSEAQRQQGRHRAFEVVISRGGGHNGFHGWGDDPLACWGDRLTAAWLQDRCRALPGAPGRDAAPQSH